MEKKKDLRVIKTRKLLYNTLLELMKDKPFEEIKVADICSNALVNRSTFYAHYNDKYELLVDFIKDLKTNLLEELEKNKSIVNTKEYYIEMIKLLLDHIYEKKEIYYSIILNNRNNFVLDILLDVATKDINNRIKDNNINKGNIPNDIVVKFYLGAVTSIVIEWLRNNKKYSKQNVIEYLEKLIPENI